MQSKRPLDNKTNDNGENKKNKTKHLSAIEIQNDFATLFQAIESKQDSLITSNNNNNSSNNNEISIISKDNVTIVPAEITSTKKNDIPETIEEDKNKITAILKGNLDKKDIINALEYVKTSQLENPQFCSELQDLIDIKKNSSSYQKFENNLKKLVLTSKNQLLCHLFKQIQELRKPQKNLSKSRNQKLTYLAPKEAQALAANSLLTNNSQQQNQSADKPTMDSNIIITKIKTGPGQK